MKTNALYHKQQVTLLFMHFFFCICSAQTPANFKQTQVEQNAIAFNSTNSNAMSNYHDMAYNFMKPLNEQIAQTSSEDEHGFEEANGAHSLLSPTAICYPGTVNRFTGSWHSNLYIGNALGVNVLQAWGQNMKDYTGRGTGNDTTPVIITTYTGVPLEVRSSCNTGGGAGLSVMALRTDLKLYVFGTVANIALITSMANFGGVGGAPTITALGSVASDVTAMLPAGVPITDVAQMAVSTTAIVIVTKATGNVYVLTKQVNLQGDKTVLNAAIWHHVTLVDGVTFLSGITKISASGSGIMAYTSAGTNKLYYWGAPANVAGVANPATTGTSYNYAYDMSAQIPAGKKVKDLEVLGTKAGASSTMFLLCDDYKVYGCGINNDGVLGINNTTVTFNQPTFITVKGIDGVTDLANIIKIDGDTEGDLYCMGALNTTGQMFGWGNSQAGMLGTNGTTGSSTVAKTVQIFSPTPAGINFTDFSVAGHFIIAFYTQAATDQYWYLGHNIGGSVGSTTNITAFILAAAPASLNSINGVKYDCSNAVLPLTWVSFTAQKKDATVALNWKTASEQDTRDFIVQHSTDGIIWKTLDIVQSTGYINPFGNYNYVHTTPANGINYYRLIQQDMDGKNSYSKIATALFNKKTNLLTIYTNMIITGKLKIQLQDASAISIYNVEGKLILRSQLVAGSHTIDVSNLAKGMYMIQAGKETEKFMVR